MFASAPDLVEHRPQLLLAEPQPLLQHRHRVITQRAMTLEPSVIARDLRLPTQLQWARHLANGDVAALILNRDNATQHAALKFADFLPGVAGGTVSYSDAQAVASVASYACDSGAAPTGDASRTCQADGSWSGTAPTSCCSDLSPTNGICVDGLVEDSWEWTQTQKLYLLPAVTSSSSYQQQYADACAALGMQPLDCPAASSGRSGGRYNKMVADANKEVEEISINDAKPLVGREDVLFIDIRDIRELAKTGRVSGARHVPRGMLEMWIDPDTPYHREFFAEDKRPSRSAFAGTGLALGAKVEIECWAIK
mgnify:CR=1 FL=1